MSIFKGVAIMMAYVWFFILMMAVFDTSNLPENPINQLAEIVASSRQ
jgi:hypothetical protein